MALPLDTFQYEGSEYMALPNAPWEATGEKPLPWLDRNFTRFIFTEQHILAEALPYTPGTVPGKGGIYFLISGNELAYVGQAVQISTRLARHVASGKRFDRFWCFGGVPTILLGHVEMFYVYTLQPPLNERYLPVDALTRKYIDATGITKRPERVVRM